MESLFFHPKLVHLPIALAVLVPPLAAFLTVAVARAWFPRRTWGLVVVAQLALLVSGLVAMQSGEQEEDRVEPFVPEAALEAHEEAAEMFVWGAGAVLALSGVPLFLRRSGGAAAATVATLGTLGVLGLGYRVGQAGGELVYRHGAAAAYVDPGTAGAGVPTSEVRGLDAVHRDHDDD